MPTVGISEYWFAWMEKILKSHIRKSKAEIVEEGLKAIQWRLDKDAEELELAITHVKEEKEIEEAESIDN